MVDPAVRVWDLAAGTTIAFATHGDDSTQVAEAMGLVLVGDTVLVPESRDGNPRIKAFDLSGKLIATVPLRYGLGASRIGSFVASPSGRWVLARLTGGSETAFMSIDRATGRTELLDLPAGLTAGVPSPTPFFGIAVAIADDGTVAMGYGDTAYRLVLIPVNGDRVEGGRSIAPRPRPPEEVARLQAVAQRRPELGFNPNFPFFEAGHTLAFDERGRLWVKLLRPREEAAVTTTFDVFGPGLEYLGEVHLEAATDIFSIGPQLLVARTLGSTSDGVRVWRIREP